MKPREQEYHDDVLRIGGEGAIDVVLGFAQTIAELVEAPPAL